MANAVGEVARRSARERPGDESHPIIAILTCVALFIFTAGAVAGNANGDLNGAGAYLKSAFEAIQQSRFEAALDASIGSSPTRGAPVALPESFPGKRG